MRRVWTVVLFLLTGDVTSASAVEVAPRVSDREIIESLAELRAGQKVLQQQIDEVKGQIAELKGSTQQQFDEAKGQMAGVEAIHPAAGQRPQAVYAAAGQRPQVGYESAVAQYGFQGAT